MSGRNRPGKFLFTPHDWYWHVTDGAHRPSDPRPEPLSDWVYSSARRAYVPSNDPAYLAWVAPASLGIC
jgi:hypothetical protein